MKTSIRILSLLLCVLMCVSLMPAAAFAEEAEEAFADFSEAEEEVQPDEEPAADSQPVVDESTAEEEKQAEPEDPSAVIAVDTPDGEPAVQELPEDSSEDVVSNDAGYSVANDYVVQVSGTYHQTEARSMLASINEFRTGSEAWAWNSDNTEKVYYSGLSELTYDYTLEKDAMQRAAEIAVYYSHTRPNGDSCFSAYSGSYSAAGENIAAGYNSFSSADEAFTAWREDNCSYSGQGHRRNMLNSYFNRVGVACYQCGSSYYYWVQEFSRTSDANSATAANDYVTVVDIYLNSELISSVTLNTSPASCKLTEGESTALPAITAKVTMSGTSWNYPPYVTVGSASFAVADTAVAKVSGSTLTGVKKGSTTLNVTALGSDTSVPVTVYGAGEMPYPESEHSYANNTNDTQTYTVPGAVSLTAVFSSSSCTETNYDKVYIYDGSDNLIGTYTGSFGGQTVTVPGDTMKVTLISDSSQTAYGYSFDSITAEMQSLEITTQPKSLSRTVGSTAKFTVAASGTGLTYQWQYSSDGGATWGKSYASGHAAATLSISVTASRNGFLYRCVVTDENGAQAISNPASLTVKPSITSQPADASGKVGSNVSFTVKATGAELSYQWQYSTNGGTKWSNSPATGNTTKSMTTSVIAYRNGYLYRCIITDANGTKLTSDAASLTVAPAITTQPKSVTKAVGNTTKFTVAATGAGLTYQWQYSKNNGASWNNSPAAGNTTATLTFKATSSRNGYMYRCVITDVNGTVLTSNAATLTVS